MAWSRAGTRCWVRRRSLGRVIGEGFYSDLRRAGKIRIEPVTWQGRLQISIAAA
jgi:hypothetical protein